MMRRILANVNRGQKMCLTQTVFAELASIEGRSCRWWIRHPVARYSYRRERRGFLLARIAFSFRLSRLAAVRDGSWGAAAGAHEVQVHLWPSADLV